MGIIQKHPASVGPIRKNVWDVASLAKSKMKWTTHNVLCGGMSFEIKSLKLVKMKRHLETRPIKFINLHRSFSERKQNCLRKTLNTSASYLTCRSPSSSIVEVKWHTWLLKDKSRKQWWNPHPIRYICNKPLYLFGPSFCFLFYAVVHTWRRSTMTVCCQISGLGKEGVATLDQSFLGVARQKV